MKKAIYSLVGFILILFTIGYYCHGLIYSNQLNKDATLYIKSTDSIDDVIEKLDDFCINIESIKKVILLKKYKKPKPGMYVLKKGINANQLINLLRSGKQTPVKVTFNNQNYIEDLAGRISKQIETDSLSILKSLTDIDFLKEKGLTSKTVLNICMPYTYDCYWNISPNALRNKLFNTYQYFWNKDRIKKARDLKLSQNEIITIASIVHKETQHKPERKRVAGVYLNRVRIGMPLQADPTVIYALKEKHGRNLTIKRVLRKDLKTNSLYNTYLNKGIPPSAIAMPDVDAIDAVLNAEKHSYLYFCANPKKFGTHNFAKNLSQHNRNAIVYQRWLNKQKVHR